MGEALGDFKSNQCLDNRALLPPCLHRQVPLPNAEDVCDKQPSVRRTGLGAAPPGAGLGAPRAAEPRPVLSAFGQFPLLGDVPAPVLSPQSGAGTLNPGAERVPTAPWPLHHPWCCSPAAPQGTGQGCLAGCLPRAIVPMGMSGRGAGWEGPKRQEKSFSDSVAGQQ